jgi:hypothetical protein
VEAQPREDLFETDIKAIKEYKDKRNKDRVFDRNNNLIQILKPDSQGAAKRREEEVERARQQEKLLRGPASFQVKSREEFLKGFDEPKIARKNEPVVNPDNSNSQGSSRKVTQELKKDNSQKSLNNLMTGSKKLDIKTAGSVDQIPRSRTDIKKPSQVQSTSNKDSVSQDPATANAQIGKSSPAEPLKKLKTTDSATMVHRPRPDPDNSKPTARQIQLEADLRRMKVISELAAKSKEKSLSPSPDDLRRKELAEERRRAKQKEEVKAHKERLQREERERKERELKEKEAIEREKREKSKIAMRERKKELLGMFSEEVKKQKEKSEEIKRKQEERHLKEEKLRKEAESLFKNDREKMAREHNYNEKITSILNSGALKPALTQFEPQLKYLFKHYIDSIDDPTILQTNLQNQANILHFRNFMTFAYQFNIVPALISIPEVKVMYLSCTKHLELDKGKPIGLDFKAFTEMLLRIAIKRQNFFKELEAEKPKSKATEGKKDRPESSKRENSLSAERSAIDLDSNQVNDFSGVRLFEDSYVDIDHFNPNTFTTLCDFLDLPVAKNSLANKLNSLRRENVRTKSRMELVKSLQRKFGLNRNNRDSKSPKEEAPVPPKPLPEVPKPPTKEKLPEKPPESDQEKKSEKGSEKADKDSEKGKKKEKTEDDQPSEKESKKEKKKDKDKKKKKKKDDESANDQE